MPYELKNLGPGPWYSVERGKLLQVGDAVAVNRIDDGTRRLADGPKPRLEITEVTSTLPSTPTVSVAAPTRQSGTAPAPTPPTPADGAPVEKKLKATPKAAERAPALAAPAPAPPASAPAERADAPRPA